MIHAKIKEAIYETRAYSTFGYGKAKIEDGQFGGQSATVQYSENDIRFTVSKDKKYLYAFALGSPAPNSKIEIQQISNSKIKSVTVVGSGAELKWSLSNTTLTLVTPRSSDMDEVATVFKIAFEQNELLNNADENIKVSGCNDCVGN